MRGVSRITNGVGVLLLVSLPTLAAETRDLPAGEADFAAIGTSDPPAMQGDRLGNGVAVGDWNDDGRLDVAMGAPGAAEPVRGQIGKVFLFFGPLPAGGLADPVQPGADARIWGEADLDALTVVRGRCDFNGDGVQDLVLTASGAGADSGVTYVIPGGASFPGFIDLLSDTSHVRLAGPAGSFSRAIGTGDVNNDGKDDVILSTGSFSRIVWIYFGRALSLPPVLSLTTPDLVITRSGTGTPLESFGNDATVGDVSGDGIPDLMVGASNDFDILDTVRGGRVYVEFGPVTTDRIFPQDADVILYGGGGSASSSLSDVLGSELIVSDVNGDGTGDLVVAALGHGRRHVPPLVKGAVNIIFGGAGLPAQIDLASLDPDVRILGTATDGLRSIASGEATGDGIADLFVSAGCCGTASAERLFGLRGRVAWPSRIDLGQVPGDLRATDFGTGAGSSRVLAAGRGPGDPAGMLVRGLSGFGGAVYTGGRVDVLIPADTDLDGTTDWGDDDIDNDGIPDALDVCPGVNDPGQADSDGDGVGDACDACPSHPDPGQEDGDGDGVADACDVCPDDGDPGQADGDSDGIGDACDTCPAVSDPDRADSDGDGQQDPCDPDDDDDLVPDGADNCRTLANPAQDDAESDGVGDVCDNCPGTFNPGQIDLDGDGFGNDCDLGRAGRIIVEENKAPALQVAIDFAEQSGDEVVVRGGVFPGPFSIPGGVRVQGSGPATILHGQGTGTAVTMAAGFLDGVTVTGGNGVDGGGIFALRGTVTNSVIQGNAAVRGAGVFGWMYMSDSIVENNTATSAGAGVFVTTFAGGTAAPTVESTLIRNNQTTSAGGGLVVDLDIHERTRITNNVITGNTALSGAGMEFIAGDGGFYYYYYDFTVTTNVVAGNTATAGGGVAGIEYTLPYGDFTEHFYNNIVSGNSGIGVGGFRPFNHDVYGNSAANYDGLDFTGQFGNISQDPLFRDPAAQDYSLLPGSPAIDAGIPGCTTDFEGVSRPMDGNLDGTFRPDMGAFENLGAAENLGLSFDGLTLQWDTHPDAVAYNLYRADVARLREFGEYTQDPSLPPAHRFCGLALPQQVDPFSPAAGEVVIYLATPEGAIEGSLGVTSSGALRLNGHPCP